MGGVDNFIDAIGLITIGQKQIKEGGYYQAGKIWLQEKGFSTWTVVHELAHSWDAANGWKLSGNMSSSLDAGFDNPFLHFLFPNNPNYWYDPGQGPPPCGVDANFNSKEDFAEAVTAFAYPAVAESEANRRNNGNWSYVNPSRGWNYSGYLDTPRGLYINALIVSLP
ncbi:MAG: hypothetical protein WAV05_02050 [Anaerolineales bacterium]